MSDKTDRLDARLLCHNALLGTWSKSYIVPDIVHIIRTLNLQRSHCERKANQIGNSINTELLRFGVNLGTKGSVTLNNEVRNLVLDQLSEHPQLEPGCTNDMIPSQIKTVLLDCYDEWDRQKELADGFAKQIQEVVYSSKWKCGDKEVDGKEMVALLKTVPGVGDVTAYVWLATVICAHRFETYLKCVAYCGFDPSNGTSGGKVVSLKKRKGNLDIHSNLCQSASVLINHASEPFGRWGQQIYERTGSYARARSAVGRRLCIALYYVQKKGEKFSYDYYRFEEPKVIDITLEELAIVDNRFVRYVRKMIPLGIETTQEMVHWFQLCKFKKVRGLGKGFYSLVREFINSQEHYNELYVSKYGEDKECFIDEERTDYNE